MSIPTIVTAKTFPLAEDGTFQSEPAERAYSVAREFGLTREQLRPIIQLYQVAQDEGQRKYDAWKAQREDELRRRDKPEISGNDVADEIESEAAITVGLINAMIAIAKVVGRSSFAHPSIKAALGWFRCDADVLAVFGQSPPSGIEGQAEEVEMIGTDETLEGWPCRAGFSGMGN